MSVLEWVQQVLEDLLDVLEEEMEMDLDKLKRMVGESAEQ